MARHTHDREDLLRDGVAMTRRGRLDLNRAEVFIGFRPQGQLSLYWDQDPVFQFDPAQKLRRVYWEGRRIKAAGGQLLSLTPSPTSNPMPKASTVSQLRFVGHPLSAAEQSCILQDLERRLQQIRAAMSAELENTGGEGLQTVGESEQEFAGRVVAWIDALPSPPSVACDAASSG